MQRTVSAAGPSTRGARAASAPPRSAMAWWTIELATRSSTSPIESSLWTTLGMPSSSSLALARWASTGEANLASVTSGSAGPFIC